MLSCWHTLLWACNAPLEYEPIRLEASPRHGRGLAVYPLQRFVQRLAGPLRPHLLGFIITSHMERLSRPSMTSMSLARFSLKYTTYFPMGIYVYGSIYSRSSTLAQRD